MSKKAVLDVPEIRQAIQEADAERVIDAAESQIATRGQANLPATRTHEPVQEPSIMLVIDRAVQSGRSTDELSALFALYERSEDRKAKAAFNKAVAAFKAERPPIVRRSENSQFKVTRNGTTTNRRYAALEDIEKAIGPTLAKFGLSYGWGDAKVEAGSLTIPCIVTHEAGHSTSALSMPVQIESKAGASDQQKMGIAQTYAMRYSLKAALGLTDVDEDDEDGNETAGEPITENQAANLSAALDEFGRDKGKFLAMFKVPTFDAIPATRYSEALAWIEKLREARKAGGK